MVRHQKSWLGFIRICALTPPTFTRCVCINSVSYPIKKFSKISREMAAVWNLWCNFRKDLALHCEHKYHYSLRFVPTFRKKAYGILRDDFFSLILSRELLLWTRAHTTSIWNFTIQWTSHDDLTEKSADNFCFRRFWKKLWNQSSIKVTSMIWQIFFARNFTEELFYKAVFQTFWRSSQTHGWILPILSL